jgi:hypothetical protein
MNLCFWKRNDNIETYLTIDKAAEMFFTVNVPSDELEALRRIPALHGVFGMPIWWWKP